MIAIVKHEGKIPSWRDRTLPNGRGGYYKNPVHTAFERSVGYSALSQNPGIKNKMFTTRVKITLLMNLDNFNKDSDNCEKAIFDGLENIVYKNDNLIKEKHIYISNKKENKEGFEIHIEELLIDKLITVSDIMSKNPCIKWTSAKIKAKIGKGKTPLKFMKLHINVEDKIWGVTKFLPDVINRKFAIWCARQCKPEVKEITNYIDVTEKFYNKKATKKELSAAYWKANYWTEDKASDRASFWTESRFLERSLYCAADAAASMPADCASERAAYWATESSLNRGAMRKKQIKKLKELIRQELSEKDNL